MPQVSGVAVAAAVVAVAADAVVVAAAAETITPSVAVAVEPPTRSVWPQQGSAWADHSKLTQAAAKRVSNPSTDPEAGVVQVSNRPAHSARSIARMIV